MGSKKTTERFNGASLPRHEKGRNKSGLGE
jgi:hypothetical protein